VGVAWLAANTVVAVYGLFDARRVLWPSGHGAALVASSSVPSSEPGTAGPLRTGAGAESGSVPRRVLVIAPHLDDAAMSCGAGIRHLVDAGAEVTVVTICTQDEEPGAELSPLARRNLRSWGLPERPFEARRAEDAQAMRVLGASLRHLGLKDAFYRTTAAGVFAYPHSVLVPPETTDAAAFARDLAEQLGPVLGEAGEARILCPAGVGGHVDHVLVRRFVEGAVDEARIVYYEEYPYSSRHGLSETGDELVGPARPQIVFVPTERELEARIDAVTCYGSQLRGLFPTSAERVTEVLSARLPLLGGVFARPPRLEKSAERARRSILSDVARVGGEVYWLGDPMARSPFAD